MQKSYLLKFSCLFLVFWCSFSACKRTTTFDPNDLVDERDGNRYSTAWYGDQRWMAENLNYNLEGSKRNPDNPITEYGRLYTYNQALIACPEGWHLPTDEEWRKFEEHLGVKGHALGSFGYRGLTQGTGLKSATGWLSNNGSNQYAFNAYPTGWFSPDDNAYDELGEKAYFWTASTATPNNALYRSLTKDYEGIYRDKGTFQTAYSCRCIED